MRILIVNDDSVCASGLIPLIRFCRNYGEVTTVVPKIEQSGKSHGIELLKPFEARQVELEPGITAWVVDSTPADCVRFAIHGMHLSFDLCISGINRGYNMGTDILYSGTVSAACEAALQGINSLAVSTSRPYYDSAIDHMKQVFDFIFGHNLFEKNRIYNVNIPPQAEKFRITRQGGPFYSDDYRLVSPDMYQACGVCVYENAGDLSLDTDAVMSGYYSVTPLITDRTHKTLFRDLQAALTED